jgi:formylglycine-generating enzyme required for sulfatase activity/dipeptide/tripeptide permease
MNISREEATVGPPDRPGDAMRAPDEPDSGDREWRHPRLLLVVALLEFCAAAGDGLTRWLVGDPEVDSAQNLHTWLAFIGAIPAGWLGDRHFGARRATVFGAVLVLAGLIAVAVPSPPAIYLGLAARAIGVALLRGNALVLLSRAYEGRERRRLEGFIWVVFAASVAGAVASLLRNEFPTAGLIAAAVVAVLFGVAIGFLRRVEATSDGSRMVNVRRASVVLALTATAVGAMLYAVDQFVFGPVIVNWLFPASAIVALVVFVFVWLRAARRMPLADNRRIKTFLKLVACSVVFGAVSGVLPDTLGAVPSGMPWPVWPLLLMSMGPGAAYFVHLRMKSHPTPSAAGVFSVAFFLQAVACIVFASMAVFVNLDSVQAVQLTLEALLVGSSWLASVLIFASGRSAATAIAPTHLTGTMLGVWLTSGAIGSGMVGAVMPEGGIDRDIAGVVMTAAAAACVLVGLILHASRHALARDEVADPPPPVPPSRLRRVAMTMSGAAAVLSIVWLVVGRGMGNDVIVAAVRTVSFGDARTAHLPIDDLYGFVRFAPGTFAFGNDPAVAGGPLASPSPTGQPIGLDELFVGKYEVTVAQYRQCVAEGACRPSDTRAIEGPDEWPVRHVSWFEANQYCAWLEQKVASLDPSRRPPVGAGMHVALPSEPEWERAAGGGADGYPWRGPLAPARANYVASARLAPVPVGEFTAGATGDGIHDLSGNVAEWTRSEYRPYPYDARDGREDGGFAATTRVIRGGSFYDDASLLRVTARQAADPSRGYEFVGFRVVITRYQRQPEPQPQSQPPAAAR